MAKFSVKKPFTVFVGVVLVIILGIVAFTKMTPDLLPNMEFPYAVIVTTVPGATSEQVESEVTKPLEQSMATLDNIKSVSSTSSQNASMVVLEFADETDMDATIVKMREKIEQIRGYWSDTVSNPYILQINPDVIPVTVAAADFEGMTTTEVSSFINDTILTKLEGTEGVARINLTGIIEETINIDLDKEKIDAANLRIQDAIYDKFRSARGSVYYGINTANDALSGISSGKSQLTSAREQLANQIEATRLNLTNNRSQLVALRDNAAALNAVYTTLTGIREGYAAANPGLDAAAIDALCAADANYQTAAAGLAAFGLTPATLPAVIAELPTVDAKIAAVDGALSQLNVQKDTMSAQLTDKLIDVSVGEAQLNMTISQLKSTLAEIESAEQAAYDSADLTGILTLDTVSSILSAQNFSMPAGYASSGDEQYTVSVGDKLEDIDEIKNLVIIDMGFEGVEPITLEEVANIYVTDNAGDTYARINGNDGVLLSFSKQSGYATATVSENINTRMAELEEKYEGLKFTVLMDQGDYIHLVVNSVLENLAIGAVLAIAILFLFLRDLRPTFITACSIPISVTFAIVLMYFSGVTLNVISLAGLAVGVGMLVDNSIVVIENIYRIRRLGASPIKAAVSGAKQVTAAIVSSTLTTICVFFPIVFVEGITRQIFSDMALTIAYSLLASLIVALTLVPAMASGMLKKTSDKTNENYEKIKTIYEKVIKFALGKKAWVIGGVSLLLVISLVLSVAKGFQFMPEVAGTEIMISVQTDEDSTLEETAQICDEMSQEIRKIEGVDSVGAMLSSGMSSVIGMSGGSASSTSSVTMYVILSDSYKGSTTKLTKQISEVCEDFDCEATVSGQSTMSSYSSVIGGNGVTVNIFGDDLDKLRLTAEEIATVIKGVEGIAGVSAGTEEVVPEIHISVDKNAAMEQGLTVAQVYVAIAGELTESKTATELLYEGENCNVVVRAGEDNSVTIDDLKNMIFTAKTASGETASVELSKIATVSEDKTLGSISRSEQRRTLSVTAELAEGYNITQVSEGVEAALADYKLADGITMEFAGENETIMSSINDLLIMLLLGVVIVYLIMVAQFQSLISPFIVMFTIPLAFTGGLFALLICGYEISVVSMIGFIMLVGIIVNNGIVLIDYINTLRLEGTERTEAIITAGVTRLRPVLMTALTTILGLLPMALGLGMGAELMQPVAVVCIGGLIYATAMTLVVIPVMYDMFSKKELRKVTEEDLKEFEE